MKERLIQTQQQKLQQTLSPLQVQFVRLLEMNDAELEEAVRIELNDNPALERSDDSAIGERENEENEFKESADDLIRADYGNEEDMPSYQSRDTKWNEGGNYYESNISETGISLMDWLMQQLRHSHLSEKDETIARQIVGDIDSNGYMTRPIRAIEDDIVIQDGVDASTEEVRDIWEKVRSLEPAGVGAVDLRDCLLLQLKRLPSSEERVKDAREIIEHYFDLFSSMKFDKLETTTGMDSSRLKAAVEVIKTLNPKPGSTFSATDASDVHANHIIPDFIVESEDDKLSLFMPNSIPSLQIEQSFTENSLMSSSKPSRAEIEARAFIRNKREEASEFIKAIKMRRDTLYRVMLSIMKFQKEFFLTDDELLLKPMILKDIAMDTGYDISVVSRATSGKYVATNRGVYPLKFFFNERLKDDSDVSSIEIMDKLREIVGEENKKRPLTDAALTLALEKAGYDLARRTVSKYREKAGLPVARLRKEI